MRKTDPRTLAIDLLGRSICNVQVAAVIFDSHGIFSWGWNSVGPDGYGLHAEEHAISRANKRRLRGASIAIAGRRKLRKTVTPSIPCRECQLILRANELKHVYIQERKTGEWLKLESHILLYKGKMDGLLFEKYRMR